MSQDQFDTIDLSDNEIKRVDNFPRMKRLKTLLLSNNFVDRIGTQLGEQIPEMEALVLTNNKLRSLSEIDHLAGLHKLVYLSLIDNPVTKQQHYRAYIIHKLPNLKVLDFKKVKFDERKLAAKLFRSEAGKKLEADVAKEGQAIASAAAAAAEKKALTDEQKKIAQQMIDSATTPEELDRVERQLRAGIFKAPSSLEAAAAAAPEQAAAPPPASPEQQQQENHAPAPSPQHSPKRKAAEAARTDSPPPSKKLRAEAPAEAEAEAVEAEAASQQPQPQAMELDAQPSATTEATTGGAGPVTAAAMEEEKKAEEEQQQSEENGAGGDEQTVSSSVFSRPSSHFTHLSPFPLPTRYS